MPTATPRISEPYPLEEAFGRVLSPLERFVRRSVAGGLVLIAATALTLVLANSPAADLWRALWEHPLTIGALEHTVAEWVNDALMAVFFLVVGLELKREIMVGELASLRDAALPVVAAVGGMVVPAAIYLAINPGGAAARGWGVPMATDIAFAIGVAALLGERVPRPLIVFLTALAIADDLGAVIAIAVAYTSDLDVGALAKAAGVLALLVVLNRGGVRNPLPYAALGVVLWYFVLHSGVHATMAGVLLALVIPVRPACTTEVFERRMRDLLGAFREHAENPHTPSDPLASHELASIAAAVERGAKAVQSPLHRLEIGLGPWVGFGVLPLFALANAAIDFRDMDVATSVSSPITIGIAVALPLGKVIGIAGAAYVAVRLGWGRLPTGVGWRQVIGVAWLGGIGFTMSLFIGGLAFDARTAELAKLGILGGSLASALIGATWLAVVSRGERQR
jgi:NhaA family Na+:H+ antiporter